VFPEDLRQLLRRQPFRAFQLRLSNGTIHEIRQPEMAAVGPSIVWINLPSSSYPVSIWERQVVVVLAHIVQIDFIEPVAPPTNN
jgi:hypothetical protein